MNLDAVRRRVARQLGRRGKGKFVAIDRKTGDYLVAPDLDTLAAARPTSTSFAWGIGQPSSCAVDAVR